MSSEAAESSDIVSKNACVLMTEVLGGKDDSTKCVELRCVNKDLETVVREIFRGGLFLGEECKS